MPNKEVVFGGRESRTSPGPAEAHNLVVGRTEDTQKDEASAVF